MFSGAAACVLCYVELMLHRLAEGQAQSTSSVGNFLPCAPTQSRAVHSPVRTRAAETNTEGGGGALGEE